MQLVPQSLKFCMQCIWQSVVEGVFVISSDEAKDSSELQFVQQLLWAVLNNCTVDTISYGQALRLCLLHYLCQQVRRCCNDHNSQRLSTSSVGTRQHLRWHTYMQSGYHRLTQYALMCAISKWLFANKSSSKSCRQHRGLVTMKIDYNPS